MTTEVTDKPKKTRTTSQEWLTIWEKHDGDVLKVAAELGTSNVSVEGRQKELREAGVILCPMNATHKKHRKASVEELNALIKGLRESRAAETKTESTVPEDKANGAKTKAK